MVVKELATPNPFADFGSIVKGSRFIGRDYEVQAIRTRTLGDSYGNIAIMGLPRTGKTSLVWNALIPKREDSIGKGNYITFIGTGTTSDSTSFFKLLLSSLLSEIEYTGKHTKTFRRLENVFDKFKEVEGDTFERNEQIQKFFKFLKRDGLRATFILDEFDNAKRIFDLADFQLLRELASKPETQICLVTISRRTIQELEPENGAISNFYGIFSEIHLGLFSEVDISKYWKWICSKGISVDENYKTLSKYFVGNHPYLIDQFNYHLFNLTKQNPGGNYFNLIKNTESDLRLSLYSSLDSAINILKEERLFSKAIQLVIGPVYDVTSKDEQRLLKYHFLKEVPVEEKEQVLGQRSGLTLQNGDKSYICFSNYLTEYFKIKAFDIDFWPIWENTENTVRELIKIYLEKKFDSPWEHFYLKMHPSENRKRLIEKLKNERNKARKKFPVLASNHIIDYTYPKDLYDLFISSDWNWFGKVFGESKQEKKQWAEKFNHLAVIRNPVAHSNSKFVPDEEINLGVLYCQEILEKVGLWMKANL